MNKTNKIKRIPLGDIIAERILNGKKGGKSYVATIRIGQPVKSADSPDYRCPYQIAGIGDNVVRSASGVDSMQALWLAIQLLAVELQFRYKEFSFTWLGHRDLGFRRLKIK